MRVVNGFCGDPSLVLDRHDAMVGSQPEAANPVSPDGAEPLVAKAGFPIDAAGEARTMPAKQPREKEAIIAVLMCAGHRVLST